MALALRRQGIACRIVDKAPLPSDKSKALVLWNRSLEMLDQLGVVERFVAAGLLAGGARMYGGGRELVHVAFDLEGTTFPKPLMIPQSETERLLVEALAETGAVVERGVELTGFQQGPERVDAVLRHPDGAEESVSVRWLIGCDGAHSTVRHALGMEFTGAAEPSDWILADLRVRGMAHDDELRIDWHEKGILAFFPMGGGRFRVIADQGKARGTGHPPDPSLADVQRAVDERGPKGLELFDPIWLAGFRIQERKVSDYARGRVFLAGDAAHIHSPAGGQGMNTGMQDAYNLAWKIALVESGIAKPWLLDTYTAERGAVGDLVLRNAAALTRVATLRNPVAQFARNTVAGVAGKISAFPHTLARVLSELDVRYPNSPLNAATTFGAWGRRWKPGDRLPEVPMIDPATGGPTSLLSAIRGPGHELLLAPASAEAAWSPQCAQLVHQLAAIFPGMVRPWLIVPSATVPEGLPSDIERSLLTCGLLAEKGTGTSKTQSQSPFPPERQGHETIVPKILLDPAQDLSRRSGADGDLMILVRPDRYISVYDGLDADRLIAMLNRYLNRPAGVTV